MVHTDRVTAFGMRGQKAREGLGGHEGGGGHVCALLGLPHCFIVVNRGPAHVTDGEGAFGVIHPTKRGKHPYYFLV